MIKQYGAIPYLVKKGELHVVLVTSASGCWIFPKGNLEEDLGKCATARLEALEEAGVKGTIHPKNAYRATVMISGDKTARLLLYPLEVDKIHEEWSEDNRRKRAIVNVADACKLIESEELKKCLWHFASDFLKQR
jgi:8-oxo-dGTP pyrophosphatase MutT (NUDIX family)